MADTPNLRCLKCGVLIELTSRPELDVVRYHYGAPRDRAHLCAKVCQHVDDLGDCANRDWILKNGGLIDA